MFAQLDFTYNSLGYFVLQSYKTTIYNQTKAIYNQTRINMGIFESIGMKISWVNSRAQKCGICVNLDDVSPLVNEKILLTEAF